MGFKEKEFKTAAKKEISKCRTGDWNHALRVVSWVKKLGKNRENLHLIIAAAYVHDIGWKGIVSKEKISIEKLKSLEDKANGNSEILVKKFLKKFNFSKKDTGIIIRLIKAADRHESNEEDEKIIVDADNLSKLSIEHIVEKYSKKELEKMYWFFKKFVPKRVKTLKGKEMVPILLEKLKNQIMPG